ncbi:MAG: DUF445 family protein [Gammaproteobacteria bacterium]
MNKSLLSNLAAAGLVLAGLLLDTNWSVYVLNTGLFALSGGITNWLAVHMLFERVPGFYGSGVIPLRFEEFKLGIRKLIMEQFFDRSGLDEFFHGSGETSERLRQRLHAAVDELDLEGAFDSLLEVILNSSFGGMLGMVGGKDALNPLKNPFVQKMREFFQQQLLDPKFQEQLQDALSSALDDETIRRKLEEMIDHRLQQMTPQMVKEIVQDMIRKHLGWLVVWGCVLGGSIGLAVTLAANL